MLIRIGLIIAIVAGLAVAGINIAKVKDNIRKQMIPERKDKLNKEFLEKVKQEVGFREPPPAPVPAPAPKMSAPAPAAAPAPAPKP